MTRAVDRVLARCGLLLAALAAGGCTTAAAPDPGLAAGGSADVPRVEPEQETTWADLPGVEGFEALPPDLQVQVAARANRARCDCGCVGHSVSACLHLERTCQVAVRIARGFVDDARAVALHAPGAEVPASDDGALDELPDPDGATGPAAGPSDRPALVIEPLPEEPPGSAVVDDGDGSAVPVDAAPEGATAATGDVVPGLEPAPPAIDASVTGEIPGDGSLGPPPGPPAIPVPGALGAGGVVGGGVVGTAPAAAPGAPSVPGAVGASPGAIGRAPAGVGAAPRAIAPAGRVPTAPAPGVVSPPGATGATGATAPGNVAPR